MFWEAKGLSASNSLPLYPKRKNLGASAPELYWAERGRHKKNRIAPFSWQPGCLIFLKDPWLSVPTSRRVWLFDWKCIINILKKDCQYPILYRQ
jgi:hypothetical protein